MAESLCCPLETITALLIGSAPTQNQKFLKNDTESLNSRRDCGSGAPQVWGQVLGLHLLVCNLEEISELQSVIHNVGSVTPSPFQGWVEDLML